MDAQTENVNPGLLTTEPAEPRTRDVGSAVEERELDLPVGRNIVVVIGIDKYQHQSPLHNAVNDARRVLKLLKEECAFQELPGVPVLVDESATLATLTALVRDQLPGELKPEDSLVLFFAGHGATVSSQVPDPEDASNMRKLDTGYLIPVEARKGRPGDWLRLDAFLDDLSILPARHVLVILDACESGFALSDDFRRRGDGPEAGTIADLSRRVSRRVMTSAMYNQTAMDGGGTGNSLFTETLAEAIEGRRADPNEDGYITTTELFSFVRQQVGDTAKRVHRKDQTPDYGYLPGDGRGELVLSLREGELNRLIEAALRAMLCHDVDELGKLVTRLVATKPNHPMILYLQFRLKFMQDNIAEAIQRVKQLRDLRLPPGTIPLSQDQLNRLSFQLDYFAPVLSLPHVPDLPIEVQVLTGRNKEELGPAPVSDGPAGREYQLEHGARGRVQATNQRGKKLFLYYVAVDPVGILGIGPLLNPARFRDSALGPKRTGVGFAWHAKGLSGAIMEKRILSSPRFIWQLSSPPGSELNLSPFDPSEVEGVQMQRISYRYSRGLDEERPELRNLRTSLATFEW